MREKLPNKIARDLRGPTPLVSIIMGSRSDWPKIEIASTALTELGVPHESKIVSAHRTTAPLFEFAKAAEGCGVCFRPSSLLIWRDVLRSCSGKLRMNSSKIIIYQNTDGNIKDDVRLEGETVWLTQEQMAVLFGKARTTLTEHIQNVLKEGELDEVVVRRNFRHTTQLGAAQGKTQETGENC